MVIGTLATHLLTLTISQKGDSMGKLTGTKWISADDTPKTPLPDNKLDKDFVGCCGGGLQRHEVCSHVKKYYAQLLLEARITELKAQAKKLVHCGYKPDELPLALLMEELQSLKGEG